MPERLWSTAWPVEVTVEFEAWYSGLGNVYREAVNAAVDTQWSAWYPKAIAAADELYELHLAELGREDLLPRE
jgi:hypothetical protein